MNERSARVRRWIFGILTLITAGVIFYFSSRTGHSSAGQSGRVTRLIQKIFFPGWSDSPPEVFENQLYALQFLVRKVAHFSIFLLLGVFAFQFLATIPIKWGLRIGICILFIALYAVSDEVHQFFTDGRSMMVFDMLVDTAGGTLGTFVSAVFSLLPENRKLREYTEKEVNQ